METVESITKFCVALHNYLMAGRLTDEGNAYCPNYFVDQEVRSKRKKNEDWWLKMIVGLFQYTGLVQIIIQKMRDMASVDKC